MNTIDKNREAGKRCRLWGMRCYLCGAMDATKDRGEGWRNRISPFLERLGVIVLNPCSKPINLAYEDDESVERRIQYKKSGEYGKLAEEMHMIRVVDLRLVDIADFLIVNLDMDIPACGTYEEIMWANRMKMPVLLRCPQGVDKIPYWIWGMLPRDHFFSTWRDMKNYLKNVHIAEKVHTMNRWVFFDYDKMVPKVTIEESAKVFVEDEEE